MYKWLRNLLFLFPPEWVHYFSMNALEGLCKAGFLKKTIRSCFCLEDPRFETTLAGIKFKNPVGLAAGFDKNARYLHSLETLGFGFVEIGTVTPLPQAGNEKPRLFRLKKDQALINRMGFNNDGMEAIAFRLKKWRSEKKSSLIIGGNIGKNKNTSNEDAWTDYEKCFLALFPYVDYFVVNVSSPNTAGLRALQEKEALKKILTNLQHSNNTQSNASGLATRPIFLKIAPDLEREALDDIIDLCMEINLDGLVATNTTISRAGLITDPDTVKAIGAGGLSGRPLRTSSLQVIRHIHEKTNGKLPVIASGGIFTAADANEKSKAGAALLQVWTGFIYEGPAIVKNILRGLRKSDQF